MTQRFADIAFTTSVKAKQEHYRTRRQNQRLEEADWGLDGLTETEAQFISERDGFYLASVNEEGWPYVQFRGGPKGFLKVLDSHTMGYADFRGNLQYISMGNISHDNRVSLILMDYARKRRIKIFARAEVVDASQAPELIEQLEMPDYRAKIERAVVLHVEAFDWNCPQHITARFTHDEVLQMVAPLQEKVKQLEAEIAALRMKNEE